MSLSAMQSVHIGVQQSQDPTIQSTFSDIGYFLVPVEAGMSDVKRFVNKKGLK